MCDGLVPIRKARHGAVVNWRVRRNDAIVASGHLVGWFSAERAIAEAQRAASDQSRPGDVIEVLLATHLVGEVHVIERAS